MIEISRLTKTFGNLTAVNDLSLTVGAGELFCFLGPNGAGKTTTIKILTTLLRATSGTVRIAGLDVRTDPLAVKKIIGYIPDTAYLYDRLTPVEFFEFAADLYAIPRDAAETARRDLFGIFGLQDVSNALIKDLSHGMRQRLIYAVTFLHEPRVLFIDEPLVGLDPYSIRLIKDILRSKARAGMTVFLTTHILALAEDIADRIGIILNGRMTEVGTLKELMDKNRNCRNLEDVFLSLTR